MANGLLQQLPSLDGLTRVRATIGEGFDTALGRLGTLGDLAGADAPLRPLVEALDTAGAIPDPGALLEPLDGVREQLSAALPTDLDDALDAVEPLLDALLQLVDGSDLAPILDELRAGRSINEIAQAALDQVVQRALGQLPGLVGGALGGDGRSAIAELLQAAGSLAGTAEPATIADFLVERVLGAPLAPLAQLAELRSAQISVACGLPGQLDGGIVPVRQILLLTLNAAADRLAALDPADPSAWADALDWLREARRGLNELRGAMQAAPAAVEAALAALDPTRYRGELRGALQALAAATRGGAAALGRNASLERLVQGMIDPLDELTATIGALSPGAFSAQLREQLAALGALLDALGEQVRSNPILDLFADLQDVVGVIADAIGGVRQALEQGIAALLQAADQVLALVDQVRTRLTGAFAALNQALGVLDIDALVAEVEQALGQLAALLEQLPLAELRTMLDQALTTIEGLVEQLSEVAETTLGQAEPIVSALEQIDLEQPVAPITAALQSLRDAIAAVDLSMLPDALRGELDAMVGPFLTGLQGSLDEIDAALRRGLVELTGGLSDLAATLQRQLERFVDAVGELDPGSLLAPLVEQFQQLEQGLADLSGAQALAPLRERLAELRAGLEQANPERLLAPLARAFEEQVLAPVQQLRPADLLQPLAATLAPVEELLGRLDFSAALGGLGAATGELVGEAQRSLLGAVEPGELPGLNGVGDSVQPLLNLLRPGAMISEWASGMNDLLGAYRPGAILQPVARVLQPLDDWLSGASDAQLLAAFGRLQTQLQALDRLELPTELFGAPLEQAAATLEASQPVALVASLATPYGRLHAALAAIERAQVPAALHPAYDEVAALVATLDPGPVFAPMAPVFTGLPGRLRALAAAPAELGALRAEFSGALSLASGAFPAFLRDELTPDGLRAGLAAFSPGAQIRRLEERFDAFLAAAERFGPTIQASVEQFMETLGERVANLSPAALFERFDELFAPIRSALQTIAPAAIITALDETYQELMTRLADLNPRAIGAAVQTLFDAALAQLDALQTELLAALAAAIDRVLSQLRVLLGQLNPTALIVGLGNFSGLIRDRLAALNLGQLLARLVAALTRLGEQLDAALTRVGDALTGLVEAV
ncbi:MAG: hypothetical protein SNJ69_06745 [Chloroflexaceae bacterium]